MTDVAAKRFRRTGSWFPDSQKRHRGDSNPCGQSPMDFESISLATRTQCLVAPAIQQCLEAHSCGVCGVHGPSNLATFPWPNTNMTCKLQETVKRLEDCGSSPPAQHTSHAACHSNEERVATMSEIRHRFDSGMQNVHLPTIVSVGEGSTRTENLLVGNHLRELSIITFFSNARCWQ